MINVGGGSNLSGSWQAAAASSRARATTPSRLLRGGSPVVRRRRRQRQPHRRRRRRHASRRFGRRHTRRGRRGLTFWRAETALTCCTPGPDPTRCAAATAMTPRGRRLRVHLRGRRRERQVRNAGHRLAHHPRRQWRRRDHPRRGAAQLRERDRRRSRTGQPDGLPWRSGQPGRTRRVPDIDRDDRLLDVGNGRQPDQLHGEIAIAILGQSAPSGNILTLDLDGNDSFSEASSVGYTANDLGGGVYQYIDNGTSQEVARVQDHLRLPPPARSRRARALTASAPRSSAGARA